LVAVASPSAIVLSPLRDAQLVAVIIIGVLLLGFLWVGAFFIAKTLRSIIGLVAGAVMFSSGKLDYKIRLSNADREFVSLADTMNTMATRIAAAEKELDEKNKEFISIATHELRTPLTAILGNLSLVYEDMAAHLDDTVRPLVKQVYESTNRLRELVNDMLDVARLEGGRAEFVLTAVDIGALATDVIANLQVTAAEKLVSLSYDRQNAQSVTADESRVRIVLNNFVSNAIKYNRPNGTVSVAHQVKDGELVTMIKDTGLGIPEDQKAHMFEKFFRVKHEDRKDVVGTGLGMHITREYVIKMGGEVWFESVHGQGTTFYFSLPLATSPERAVTTP
jgi:signal transduction histidine kinase